MIAAAANEMGTGEFVVYLLVGLGIIVLAVIWILFPIMVWMKLNELLEAQREAQREIYHALLAANTVRDEIAKALQWMVNNWRDDIKPPPTLG
jgi:hypothetical protein